MKGDVRDTDQPIELELGPAQPIMDRDYGRNSNYTGESSRSIEPMKRRKAIFDDGVRIGSKDR